MQLLYLRRYKRDADCCVLAATMLLTPMCGAVAALSVARYHA